MKAPGIIYAIVIPMIVFLIQIRPFVRPEMISNTFLVIALMLYFRSENKISTGNMLAMAALMLVWGNHHTSIIGYIVLFGFFLGKSVVT